MTGPEHYRASERLLVSTQGSDGDVAISTTLAAAQVHATLALVAIAAIAAGEWWE